MDWKQIKKDFPKAKWISIIEYKGEYKISDNGLVYSLKSNKLLSINLTSNGYVYVMLSKKGKQKTHRIHRLVAEAFIPNPENKCDVNHIDSNRTNNVLKNLEWATRSENLRHCVKTRNIIDGENNYRAKYKRWQIIIMRYLYHEKKWKGKTIAKVMNIKESNVFQICSYKRYAKIVLEGLSSEEISGCLLRFFDEQGIHIGLVIGNNNMNICHPPIFEYEILQIAEDVQHDSDCHSSRSKAETAAFAKAFKILEKKWK